MKKVIAAFALLIFLSNCSNNSKENTAAQNNEITEEDSTAVNFFPVTAFLKGQMAELDSLPITFLYTRSQNNSIDSAWVKRDTIHKILQPFADINITEHNLTHLFTASKFNDQSVEAITFTHTPKGLLPDSIKLRNWSLYISPETGKIIKLYLLLQYNNNKETVTQQLTWQTGKWAKITTLQHTADNKNSKLVKEEKLIWDFD
ncbi:MAG TPA: hypothetical protein PKC39_00435 [Ferruginibacter sp.]|nr:hypothetical protein [Ferruginibacter sp.]HMP19397.1 hypothetical protein [Ferruginibacter sp.]